MNLSRPALVVPAVALVLVSAGFLVQRDHAAALLQRASEAEQRHDDLSALLLAHAAGESELGAQTEAHAALARLEAAAERRGDAVFARAARHASTAIRGETSASLALTRDANGAARGGLFALLTALGVALAAFALRLRSGGFRSAHDGVNAEDGQGPR